MVIAAIDEQDIDGGVPQSPNGPQAGESATDNNDAWPMIHAYLVADVAPHLEMVA